MPLTRLLRGRVRQGHLLLAWIVVFTAASVYGIAQNRWLIDDVQDSRLVSCRQTYEGVREVFLPLFPPLKSRTAAQQKTLDTFNETVDRLKRRCARQVNNEGGTP